MIPNINPNGASGKSHYGQQNQKAGKNSGINNGEASKSKIASGDNQGASALVTMASGSTTTTAISSAGSSPSVIYHTRPGWSGAAMELSPGVPHDLNSPLVQPSRNHRPEHSQRRRSDSSHSHRSESPPRSNASALYRQEFRNLLSPENVQHSVKGEDWCCFVFQSATQTCIVGKVIDGYYVDGPYDNSQVQLLFFADQKQGQDFIKSLSTEAPKTPWPKSFAEDFIARKEAKCSPFSESATCLMIKYLEDGSLMSHQLIHGRSCGMVDYTDCVRAACQLRF